MTQVQIDDVLVEKLGGLDSAVELRNSQGITVGHYLPEAEYTRMLYASYKCNISDEELERRAAEPGGYTLEEIWKELGAK